MRLKPLLLALAFLFGLGAEDACARSGGGSISLYPVPDWNAVKLTTCQRYAASANCLNTMIVKSPPSGCTNLVITSAQTVNGGCYSSPDDTTSPIAVNTTQAVIIENATIYSATKASGISGFASNITANNNDFLNAAPTNGGSINLTCNTGGTCTFTNNRMSGGGIYVQAPGGAVVNSQGNVAADILGFTGGASHFIQYSNGTFSGSTINLNAAVNTPGITQINDVINLYNTIATSGSPITVTQNYILGAYPLLLSSGFSGCGIIMDGPSTATALNATQFVNITSNVVMDTTNGGICIAGGHDNQAFNNTVVSSGVIQNQLVLAQNVGIYVSRQTGQAAGTVFFHNNAYNNNIYWLKAFVPAINDFFPGFSVAGGCDTNYGSCSNTGISSTTDFAAAVALETQYISLYFK